MALAGKYNFALQRGSTETRQFVAKSGATPVDLTGWHVRMQIRSDGGEEGVSTTQTLLLDMPEGNGIDITNAVGGEITLELTPTQTQLINPSNETVNCPYGLELYQGAPEIVTPLLQGTITVFPETAR